jgi:hypothetical protein
MDRRRLYVGWVLGCLCGSSALQAVSEQDEKRFAYWGAYADFLYMKRTELHAKGIVINSANPQDPDKVAINSKDLLHGFEFEPGYRVGMFYNPSVHSGFEGSFFSLGAWEGRKGAHAVRNLSVPFESDTYDADFTDADRARARYRSRLWGAELNYWRHAGSRGEKLFGLSGIFGFRFFHWDEGFSLAMTNPPDTSRYIIHTENRVLGFQVGFDFRMNPSRKVHFDLLAKAGALANSAEQDQFLGDFGDLLAIRSSQKQAWQAGVFADVAAQLALQPLPWFSLRVGYEMLFLSGLALAPEQVSFAVGPNAGKRVNTKGHAIAHGLFAGLVLEF